MQKQTIPYEAVALGPMEATCKYCGRPAYKSDGNGDSICRNRAFNGFCFKHEGLPHKRTSPKIERNQPCPCGSGAKFKHCHGRPV